MRTLLAFAIGLIMLVSATAVKGMETYDGLQEINWDDCVRPSEDEKRIVQIENPVAIKEPEFQVPDLIELPIMRDIHKRSDASEWYTLPDQPTLPGEWSAPEVPEVPKIGESKVDVSKLAVPKIEIPKMVFTPPEISTPSKLPALIPIDKPEIGKPNEVAQETLAAQEAQEWLADYLGVPTSGVKITEVTRVDWPDSCLGLCGPDEVCSCVVTPGYSIICNVEGEEYEVRFGDNGVIRVVE